MTLLDGPLRAVTDSLLGQFGALGTIGYVTTGEYNPSTGKASQDEGVTASTRGIVEQYRKAEIDGTVVLRGDFKWSVPALGITKPSPNDTVTLDSVRYTVVNVESVYSGDEAALHVLQLRR